MPSAKPFHLGQSDARMEIRSSGLTVGRSVWRQEHYIRDTAADAPELLFDWKGGRYFRLRLEVSSIQLQYYQPVSYRHYGRQVRRDLVLTKHVFPNQRIQDASASLVVQILGLEVRIELLLVVQKLLVSCLLSVARILHALDLRYGSARKRSTSLQVTNLTTLWLGSQGGFNLLPA
jgi:hypothetical protein